MSLFTVIDEYKNIRIVRKWTTELGGFSFVGIAFYLWCPGYVNEFSFNEMFYVADGGICGYGRPGLVDNLIKLNCVTGQHIIRK